MQKKHPTQPSHRIRNIVLHIVLVLAAIGFVLLGVFLLWASTLTLPAISAIEAHRDIPSTKIYDKTGEILLFDMYQDVRRTEVPLTEISSYVQHATIAIEDERFYAHTGIDPEAILRAIVQNISEGDLLGGQGGSTITQQVIKNALLSREKTLTRKLKEWVLAIKLEQTLTKDEILELYLNEVPYGGNKYGIEEASQGFFGIPASQLSLAQSAYLAALPQAPTYYSPYGSNVEDLENRKNIVLKNMHQQGYITEEEYTTAKNESVTFNPNRYADIKAPHFVFYVIEQLAQEYGDAGLPQLGLRVITTLDWDLQNAAERIVYEHATENADRFNATNAALMAIDPTTGGILTMVGSRDYFDESIDGNFNIGLAERQPGSSFKPFAYAAALEKGYTTETVVYDVATQFSTNCAANNFTSTDGCYSPGNYDNVFRGPMTFREALAQSVNIPAVKAIYLAGMKNTIELAERMGVSTLEDYRRYGLTLVLGGGEVSLIDMTSAYATFANEGRRFPVFAISKVEDAIGNTLFEDKPESTEVLNTEVARGITDILADNIARTPAFGAQSYLHFPGRDVAVKTGTTNDYRDAWIIGYTPKIAVGAWAGNNDNSPMEKKVAGFIIAPLWNEFLQFAFEQEIYNGGTFTAPLPISEDAQPVLRGIKTPEGGEHHNILHYVNKENPLGAPPVNPAQDPQYSLWEYGVQFATKDEIPLPDSDEDGDVPEASFSLTIEEPRRNDWFRLDDIVTMRISADTNTITRTEYLIDDQIIHTADSFLQQFSFMPGEEGLSEGRYTITVHAYDETGARASDSVNVRVRE